MEFREKLEQNLNEFNVSICAILELFTENLQYYSDSMQKSINENEYFSEINFLELHQSSKDEAISKFQSQSRDNELKSAFRSKLDVKIDQTLPAFEAKSVEKRQDFLVSMKFSLEQMFFSLIKHFKTCKQLKYDHLFYSNKQIHTMKPFAMNFPRLLIKRCERKLVRTFGTMRPSSRSFLQLNKTFYKR